MRPIDRYVDSYPFHGNQVPVPRAYHPSFEAVPPYTKVDPSKCGNIYGPWPYANNFGYSVPCHSCYGNGNFPGYYSFSCPHLSTPQFHCCGHHPPFSGSFPIQYVHPPHYSMEQPMHEYDKGVPRDYDRHCCGCSNHTHIQRNDGIVKIEEQEPDAEKKGGDSLIPLQLKNNPHPFLWIPPQCTKNNEHKKSLESEMTNIEKASRDKPPENVMEKEKEPRVWNGWFPLDMKRLGKEGKTTQNSQNEDKTGQFPFPIIWMPSYDRQYHNTKEDRVEVNVPPKSINAAAKSVEESPSSIKFFPVKLANSDNSRNQIQATLESFGSPVASEMVEKSDSQKSITMEQKEEQKDKENSEDTERRGRAVSVKTVEDNGTSKGSGASVKEESSSPTQTPNLPPVCLRVDPMPKKKNGNASSRSPCPGAKAESQETSKCTRKSSPSSDVKSKSYQDTQVQSSMNSKQAEAKKYEGKVMEVVERRTGEKKDEERSGSQTQIPVTFVDNSQSPITEKNRKHGDKWIIEEDKGPTNTGDLIAEKDNGTTEAIDVNVSNGERKGDRRKLSHEEAALLIQSAYRGFVVRKWEPRKKLKQIAEVREQMVVVKNQINTLESSSDLGKDDKRKAVIGEMIMRLLLKLDTIQGLHPSVRDVRKSLVRELVVLQEKLDSLWVKKYEGAIAKSPEDPILEPNNSMGVQEGERREAGEQPIDFFPQIIDAVCGTQGEETVSPENQRSDSKEIRGTIIDDTRHGSEDEVDKLKETPHGVIEKETAVYDEEEKQIGGEMMGIVGEVESSVSIDSTPSAVVFDELKTVERNAEMNPLEELPLGVIDVEAEKHGTQDNEVVHGEYAEWKEAIDAPSPERDGSTPDKSLQQSMKVLDNYKGYSVAESTDLRTVASQKDNYGSGDAMLEGDVQQPVALEVDDDNEHVQVSGYEEKEQVLPPEAEVPILSESEPQPMEVHNEGFFAAESVDVQKSHALVVHNHLDTSGPEEMRQQFSQLQKESHDQVCEGGGDKGIGDTKADEEEHRNGVPEEKEHHEVEMVGNSDKMTGQPSGPETAFVESLIKPKFTPLFDEEERESIPAASLSIDEKDTPMESDRKLVEEKEILREMMEKLIEAGKEQLTVITNLAGRVRDLESKL